MTKEAVRILEQATAEKNGYIKLKETLGGSGLTIGSMKIRFGTVRERAKWKSALNELVAEGMIQEIADYADTTQLYELTGTGQNYEELL